MLSFMTGIDAQASNRSEIVDNDPIAPGCSYTFSNNMYYHSDNGSYNNDMRISSYLSSYNTANVTYTYPIISVSSPTYLRIGIYLNHTNFTDENAHYNYQTSSANYSTTGNFNQNNAAATWNYVYNYSISMPFYGSKIMGYSSTNYNQQFGSDAMKMTVYY